MHSIPLPAAFLLSERLVEGRGQHLHLLPAHASHRLPFLPGRTAVGFFEIPHGDLIVGTAMILEDLIHRPLRIHQINIHLGNADRIDIFHDRHSQLLFEDPRQIILMIPEMLRQLHLQRIYCRIPP